MNEQVEQFFFLIFVFVFSKNILGEGQVQPQRALAVGGIEEASFLREISLNELDPYGVQRCRLEIQMALNT